jgi:toxin ParE1/3/4
MDKYKVKLNRRAFRDIDSIFEYIALEKQSPENAKGQTDRIWEALKSLDTFQQSYQERTEGRYAGKFSGRQM